MNEMKEIEPKGWNIVGGVFRGFKQNLSSCVLDDLHIGFSDSIDDFMAYDSLFENLERGIR